MNSEISMVSVYYTARGLPRYSATVQHRGLRMIQEIRGDDPNVVAQKAVARAAQWNERWEKRVASEQRSSDRAARSYDRETKKNAADEQTTEAELAWKAMETILVQTLSVDDAINWDQLKDRSRFDRKKPVPPQRLEPPPPPRRPPLPDEGDEKYQDHPTFFESFLNLFSSKRKKLRLEALRERFERDLAAWKQQCGERETEHAHRVTQTERENQKLIDDHAIAVRNWEAEKAAFLSAQAARNSAIDAQRERYVKADPEAIEDYCDLVLGNSQYPDWMPREWTIDFEGETKMLVVDYRLPSLSDLPTLKAVKYNASRDSLEESHYSDAQLAKAYDSVVYQVALRTLHELFEADRIAAIDSIAWNGRVKSTDPATGHEVDACVVSLHVRREEFEAINLAAVEPKTCFRKLRGVGSSKLHSLTPVAPLVQMKTEDARFTESYAVAATLEEGENLASMDWEDFEHLVREVFEKEFANEGAEVKVTRASRDGGIDAVVFDPHPIRGGKIVIQAKRYTATVGVSAVRDLYGTVMNEGANKGILVTTATFGPDAYAFAREKPLTLVDGGTLLHLLQKHGHKVRIDLVEARQNRNT